MADQSNRLLWCRDADCRSSAPTYDENRNVLTDEKKAVLRTTGFCSPTGKEAQMRFILKWRDVEMSLEVTARFMCVIILLSLFVSKLL